MEQFKRFLARKDIVFTLRRYGIDALAAMAQGLFCTLLVGTILNTLGQQLGIGFLLGGSDRYPYSQKCQQAFNQSDPYVLHGHHLPTG